MKASAALVAGLALATAGCSVGDDEEPPEGRAQPKLVNTTAVEGGSGRERALLRRVVGGMEKMTLERITIAPPEGRRDTDGEEAVAITFTPVPGVTTRRQWDEWIVAGAFSRRLFAAGLADEVDGADDRGAFTARAKLRGESDPRPLSSDREAAVVKGIRNAVRKSGADLVALDVHRPYGAAVTLTLAPKNPARFLQRKLRPLLRRLDVYRARLEGVYLAVLDEDRRLVLEWGSWTRNPAGSYWVRRDLTRCSPIQQSEPPGSEPAPSCPA